MAAGSFSQEQIRHFRQVYSQYSAAGLLTFEGYQAAVVAALQQASLSSVPPPEFLSGEFERLSGDSGGISWQQFFQVLMHINLSYGNSSNLLASQSAPVASTGTTREAEAGAMQRSHGVSFSQVVDDHTPSAPPPGAVYEAERNAWGRTLRRGGAALGRAVGNFFGVTDESQHGSANTVGWEAVSVNRAEEGDFSFLTLSRRPSRRPTYDANEPPPSYPDIVGTTEGGLAAGRSFDPTELSDSDEDDDAFITQAPPDYNEVVAQPPEVQFPGSGQRQAATPSGVTRVSVYANEDELVLVPPPQQQYPAPSHPAPTQQSVVPPRDDLIYNKEQALEYYLRFIKAEKRLRQRRHRDQAYSFFGGEGGVDATAAGESSGTHRRGRLQSVDQPVTRRRKKPKRTKLQRQSTLVRHKVESLPTFWPIFIVLVTLAQVAGMVVLLAVFGTDSGLAPIEIAPKEYIRTFPSLSDPSGEENVTYYRAVNLWIGLTPPQLIRIGAKFTPCMRTDFEIRRRNTRINDEARGCCKNTIHFGTTTPPDCAANIVSSNESNYDSNYTCSDIRSPNYPPTFHPCCISITGKCAVVSEEECDARNGWFNPEFGDCSEVNCFESICGFSGAYVGEEGDNPTLPSANQFWRWFLSIFIHLGVIHLVIVMPIQLYVGIKIERTIGWLRVGLIYIISGVGGNIVSGIFIPYEVNAGASGAVFGLLGVLFVELFQFWQIVDHAYLELLKLAGFVFFLLALGTLPYVDNMAHIGGLVFGVVSSIIFVPYITFGKWDAVKKRVLLLICLPLLLVMLVAGFITFYLIPNPEFCTECQYINCVPYTSELCPDEFINADPDVFSL